MKYVPICVKIFNVKEMAESVAFASYDGFDPGRRFIESVPELVRDARNAARNDAHSYRGFRVGAAAFAYNPRTGEVGKNSSGNVKTGRGKPKHCAEANVLQTVKKSGLTIVGGLVVAGTTSIQEIQEVTGFETRTLHPCTECRDLLCHHPLIKEDTLVLTTGIDVDVYQVHTTKELKALYETEDPSFVEGRPCEYGFSDWGEHLAIYDHLRAAEASMPMSEQRSMSKLVQMALLAER